MAICPFDGQPSLLFPCVLFIISVLVFPTMGRLERNNQLSKNVSYLLNTLLNEEKYDRKIRPGYGGAAVIISVNMYIRSLGPISEMDEDYSIDCYFRQSWFDPRLMFNATLQELSMNWKFLEKVWKPDTYFINGKESYLHKVTVPNKFLRLRKDGKLTYSMRLTIKASCPMHLRKFPLDSQACPLEIGSYGYNTNDVIYKWDQKKVGLEDGVSLAQYDLVKITTLEKNKFIRRRGVTTVLTMTTMGFGGRSALPRVSYATALDWFVIMCFAFVFASMIEYATINFIEQMNKTRKAKLIIKQLNSKKHEEARALRLRSKSSSPVPCNAPSTSSHYEPSELGIIRMDIQDEEKEIHERSVAVKPHGPLYWCRDAVSNLLASRSKILDKISAAVPDSEEASLIDVYSRKLFPLTFLILNTIYWVAYVYYISDEFDITPMEDNEAAENS